MPKDSHQIFPFTPLESPVIYGGDDMDIISTPYRKGGVKAPSFLTGFTCALHFHSIPNPAWLVPNGASQAKSAVPPSLRRNSPFEELLISKNWSGEEI